MNIAETAAQLQTIQQAMILIHQSPDGDCIGSGYALAALLRQMGCHAVVRCSDPIPERYAFLTVEETPDTVDEDAAVILFGRCRRPQIARRLGRTLWRTGCPCD